MKCQFIDNDDFFEEYILDRIGEVEKRAFEKHLSECNACSEKLVQLNKVVAGIRAVGRTEMKAEIRRQAELAAVSQKINWSAVSRIAALAFVLILTPTMYYIYKNQVQPASAPLARSVFPPASQDADFTDALTFESAPSEKQDKKQTSAQTRRDLVKTSRPAPRNQSFGEPDLARQVPAQQKEPKKKVQKEELKREQAPATMLAKARKKNKSLDVDKIALNDEETNEEAQIRQAESEHVSVRLNSMSGAAVRAEEPGFPGISKGYMFSKSVPKDALIVFSKTIILNGRQINLQIKFEQSPENEGDAERTAWPAEFPVVITKPDSNTMTLHCDLLDIQSISADDFSAKGISEIEIEIHFGKSATYRIKIERADSKAIRID